MVRRSVPLSERGWLLPAALIVGSVSAFRLAILALNGIDLFVDEAQYWLWGQGLDWGYYSKPPLIAWVIRGVTELAGSDAPFWVRMPGPLLHGATALILGAVAARAFGARAAIWVAAGYVTLPMASLGSLLFSTDTVMAPFYAGALLFWMRAADGRRSGDALAAGLCLGLAVMAKYAGIYALIGMGLAAVAVPGWRLPLRFWAVMGVAALAVIAPNIWWNLTHDLTTLSHTADNAGWLRGGVRPDAGQMAGFLLAQAAVVGPIVAGAFLWRLFRRKTGAEAALMAFSLPPLLIVSAQALLGGANANWAVAGWLAGAVVAWAALAVRPFWAWAGMAVNGAVAIALPLVTLFPALERNDTPLLRRYLGIADLSRQIIAVARAERLPIVADRRDVLADLHYTGRDAGLTILARPRAGRPMNFYEQTMMLPQRATGPVLLVSGDAGACATGAPQQLQLQGGAYVRSGLALWRVTAECLNGTR